VPHLDDAAAPVDRDRVEQPEVVVEQDGLARGEQVEDARRRAPAGRAGEAEGGAQVEPLVQASLDHALVHAQEVALHRRLLVGGEQDPPFFGPTKRANKP
jgi:hypothetical protein